MIVFVDLEHEQVRQTEDWSPALTLKTKYRLEDISAEPCLVVRYEHVTPKLMRDLKVRALLVSGCASEFECYDDKDLAGLRAVFQEAAWPTLGFCGGCQIMAQTHGAEIGAIGPLLPGAPEMTAERRYGYSPGMKQERGFMPVRVLEPHALFEGLGRLPNFLEAHYWEVKAPPTGFRVYAATDVCGVQMLAHERLPLYATQFHPEQYDDDHPDGRRFLENFFRIAGIK